MELAVKPKYVWWDVDCLNVRRGGDPYEYRWVIESALNKKFGDGPVTIFAIGNMNRIPLRVLELISRAGIVIKHTTKGGRRISTDLVFWTKKNPTPAIVMLISDREDAYLYLEIIEARYTVIRTYVNQNPDSPNYASHVWLWKSLLTDTKQHENTPRPWQELQGKCCETDWECLQCAFQGQGFTDFTTHLKTIKHLHHEWLVEEDLRSKLMAVMPSKRRKYLRGGIANPAIVAGLRLLSGRYSVIQPGNDLASPHSQPKKHTMSRNLEAAGPCEALLPYRCQVTLVDAPKTF